MNTKQHAYAVLCGATCVVFAGSGCTTAPKWFSQSKTNPPPAVAQSTSTPGSMDQPVGNELRNPARVHLAYAQWHEQTGQLTEARDAYQKALTANPKSVEALLGMARIEQAYGRAAEAEAKLKQAQRVAPKDARVFAAYGQFEVAQENLPLAIEKFRAATEAEPFEPAYRFQLGLALAKSGDVEGAFPHFRQSIGEAEAYYNIGHIYYENGNLTAAEQNFTKALERKPDLIQARTMLAKLNQPKSNTTLAGGQVRGGFEELPKSSAAAPADRPVQPVVGQSPYGSASFSQPPGTPLRAKLTGSSSEQAPATQRIPSQSALGHGPSGIGGPTADPSVPLQGGPTPPPGMTPQQLEQWQNQVAPQ